MAQLGCGQNQPGSWAYNLLPYIDQKAIHDLGLAKQLWSSISTSDPNYQGGNAADTNYVPPYTTTIILCSQRMCRVAFLTTSIQLMLCPSRRHGTFPVSGTWKVASAASGKPHRPSRAELRG